MPYTYTIEGRLIRFRWSGEMVRGDLEALAAAMPGLAQTVVQATGLFPQVLHDFGAVVACEFPPVVAYEHSQRYRAVAIPQPVKSAIIATPSSGRAMARVFQATNRNPNLFIEIFDTEAAARRWLAVE